MVTIKLEKDFVFPYMDVRTRGIQVQQLLGMLVYRSQITTEKEYCLEN